MESFSISSELCDAHENLKVLCLKFFLLFLDVLGHSHVYLWLTVMK
jgi:hypothetical protein